MCFVICSVNNSLVENVILSYNMGRRKTTVLHCIQNWINIFQKACRYKGIMSASESVGNNTQKKLIKIDISSDTVCPWCFVGKKNLDKAIAASKDHHDFEVCSLSLSLSLSLSVFVCVCARTFVFPLLSFINYICRLDGIHFNLILLPQKKASIRKNITGTSLDLKLRG